MEEGASDRQSQLYADRSLARRAKFAKHPVRQTQTGTAEQSNMADRQMRAALKRGFMYFFNLLFAGIGVGTAGIGFLITGIPYALTLFYFNLEMIYGRWIKKGEDPYIAPISYDPVPMPIDEEARLLQWGLIGIDLFFLFVVVPSLCISMIFLIAFATNPLQAMAEFGILGFELSTLIGF